MSVPNQITLLCQGPVNAIVRHPSTLQKGLMSLFKLAFKSRLRLSYLIIIAFMILDIRMTLEVVVDLGRDDEFDDTDEASEISDSDSNAGPSSSED